MNYKIINPEIAPVGTNGEGDLFNGKRCFITGASSGIGYGITERLLQRGAKEVWICSRNEERMKKAAETLNEKYGRVRWAAVDVSDAEALTAFMNEMAAEGPIDYVFANAGVTSSRCFEKTTREEFDRVMVPNFYGVFNADQAAIPVMLKQGFGHILNMSSMEGFVAGGFHAAYVASKHAVFGLTESLRHEYADRNIRFSVICPGPVQSNIWGKDSKGNLHEEVKAPEGVITELQAADEILAGIEEERNVILVTDTSRTAWEKKHKNPESADRWLKGYTKSTKAVAEYIEATGR